MRPSGGNRINCFIEPGLVQPSDAKHPFDAPLICRADNCRFAQVPFALGCLLGQDVALVRFVTAYFSRRGDAKSFTRRPTCLELWHLLLLSLRLVRLSFRPAPAARGSAVAPGT